MDEALLNGGLPKGIIEIQITTNFHNRIMA
jgi:hypothetical protein